jgi:catechol 2,3-dioxygenase-like lactoylglutathione lyase family enzyme
MLDNPLPLKFEVVRGFIIHINNISFTLGYLYDQLNTYLTAIGMNLNQITVPSLDVSISIAFYKNLGLQLIVEALPHYARFVCPDGNATFSVHLVEALPKGPGVIIYFEYEHLDEEVDQLVKKGIEFEELPKDQPWLWREARLKDPDGNQLILYHGGENRLNPPWRIQ